MWSDPLPHVAAIGFYRGEATKAVAASQFPLLKMLTELLNCDVANSALAGSRNDVRQERGGGVTRGLRVCILLDCSFYPLAIDSASTPILFRPAKLPNIWSVFSTRLNDASLLHKLPPCLWQVEAFVSSTVQVTI